ncbi:MAG: DUF4347 domain-containing protein, partial [Gammaproteobacteria bacterium]|nr:DUF4347 domain-containing protein [Gammaproteobacteria bacterium]
MFKKILEKLKTRKQEKNSNPEKKPVAQNQQPSTLSDSLKELEPRIMLDAAAVATGAEVAADNEAEKQAEQAASSNFSEAEVPAAVQNTEKLFESLAEMQPPAESNEIVFIDRGVDDYETLLSGLNSNAEVIFIDTDSDGVLQIADALSNRENVDAVHIIAHGDAGQLQLGNSVLTQESMLNEYSDPLSALSNSLGEDADILIYGCNFGQGTDGLEAANT